MRLRQLFVVALALAALAPAVAAVPSPAPRPAAFDANVAWFAELLGERYDADAQVTLTTVDGERTLTLEEAAALFAHRAGDVDVGLLVQQGLVGGGAPDPMVGEVWLLETYVGPAGNPTGACNQGGGGDGGHYYDAVALDLPPKQYPYVGDATSHVSRYGLGIATWWDDPQGTSVVGYRETVHYAGSSDFWCMSFEHLGTFVMNFPFVFGAVAWGRVSPPCPRVLCSP